MDFPLSAPRFQNTAIIPCMWSKESPDSALCDSSFSEGEKELS